MGEPTCPVSMMEKYFRMGELESTPKECVFRGISVTKNGERLRKTGGLSYTRSRELLLSKISQLGYDPTGFEILGAAPAPRRYFIQYAGSPVGIPALCAGKCRRT